MSASRRTALCGLAWLCCSPAQASLLQGGALDTAANAISWVALLVVPVVLVSGFWWLHIMPEKVAEKRKHPQLAAIKIICLLSLVFGGLLWPFAWVWAYTRPVLHKLAYGTDTHDEHGHGGDAVGIEPTPEPELPTPNGEDAAEEVSELRRRIQSLEAQLAAVNANATAQAQGRGAAAEESI